MPVQGLFGKLMGQQHLERALGVHREIGALGQVLTKQPVSVLADAPLPRTFGIGEVDLEPGTRRQRAVQGHLLALIIGQRPAQPLGHRLERATEALERLLG